MHRAQASTRRERSQDEDGNNEQASEASGKPIRAQDRASTSEASQEPIQIRGDHDYPADLTDSISDLGSSSLHDCGGRSGHQQPSSCMSAAFSNLDDEIRARRVASARLTTRKVDEHGLQGQLIARSKSRKTERGCVACPACREAERAPSDKLESDEAPPQHPRANDDACKFKTTSARSRPPRPHSRRHLVDPQPITPSQAPRNDSEHNAPPPSSTHRP
ncbi:hypothetical protein EV714DRAFT_278165 [Schizophyllum commune]